MHQMKRDVKSKLETTGEQSYVEENAERTIQDLVYRMQSDPRNQILIKAQTSKENKRAINKNMKCPKYMNDEEKETFINKTMAEIQELENIEGDLQNKNKQAQRKEEIQQEARRIIEEERLTLTKKEDVNGR